LLFFAAVPPDVRRRLRLAVIVYSKLFEAVRLKTRGKLRGKAQSFRTSGDIAATGFPNELSNFNDEFAFNKLILKA
jgi:hypothetical protein